MELEKYMYGSECGIRERKTSNQNSEWKGQEKGEENDQVFHPVLEAVRVASHDVTTASLRFTQSMLPWMLSNVCWVARAPDAASGLDAKKSFTCNVE